MKTTRRSFFGLVAGAGLGGKRALAETTEKLAMGTRARALLATGSNMEGDAAVGSIDLAYGSKPWANERLAKLLDPRNLAKRWKNTSVHTLDQDLACQHSRSLSSRVVEQRRRNFERDLTGECTWFDDIIAGHTHTMTND